MSYTVPKTEIEARKLATSHIEWETFPALNAIHGIQTLVRPDPPQRYINHTCQLLGHDWGKWLTCYQSRWRECERCTQLEDCVIAPAGCKVEFKDPTNEREYTGFGGLWKSLFGDGK